MSCDVFFLRQTFAHISWLVKHSKYLLSIAACLLLLLFLLFFNPVFRGLRGTVAVAPTLRVCPGKILQKRTGEALPEASVRYQSAGVCLMNRNTADKHDETVLPLEGIISQGFFNFVCVFFFFLINSVTMMTQWSHQLHLQVQWRQPGN